MLLIGAGVVLVWRQADNARRAHWIEVGRRTPRAARSPAALAGVALVGVGLTGFVVVQGSAAQLGTVLTGRPRRRSSASRCSPAPISCG